MFLLSFYQLIEKIEKFIKTFIKNIFQRFVEGANPSEATFAFGDKKMKLKCPHCNGEFQITYKKESQRYLLKCKKCGCLFGTVLILRSEKCISNQNKIKFKKKRGKRKRKKK